MALQPFPLTHVLEARRVPRPKSLEREIDDLDAQMAAVDQEIAGAPVVTIATGAEGTTATANAASPFAAPKPSFDPLSSPVTETAGPDTIVFALPIPPESVRYEPVPASVLTFTQSSATIEDQGQRLTNVTISGKVGVRYRLGTDRLGSPRYWESPRLFYELREFLGAVAKNNATPGAAPYRLIWRDFGQKLHQYVKLDPYLWEFDDRNKLAPRYEFRLQAYAEAKAEPASLIQEALGDAINGARDVADYIDVASMWVQVARANAADALNAVGAILAPIAAIDRLLESVQDLSGEIRNGRALVKSTISSVIGIADAAIYTIQKFIEDLGISRGDAPWFEDTHAAIREAQNAVALSFVVSGLSEQKKDQVYKVKRGDTLASIAFRQYGVESEAPSIAAANKLLPPFVSLAKIPNTVGPGDEIILPAATTPTAVSDVFPIPTHTVEERLFGVDVYRSDLTGEWEVAPGGDDVRLVRGQPAAEQGLSARLSTIAGSNMVFPRVGMPRAVGEPNYDGTAALLLVYLQEQVAADDRVDGVDDPEGVDGGTGVSLAVRIRLRGNRRTSSISIAA